MMAVILPFPRVRDRRFVTRHARRMADLCTAAAENHLATQLDLQRRTMLRRGIDHTMVDEQIRALEMAVRAELWRVVLTPGGAA
jgi:hypothetical protein